MKRQNEFKVLLGFFMPINGDAIAVSSVKIEMDPCGFAISSERDMPPFTRPPIPFFLGMKENVPDDGFIERIDHVENTFLCDGLLLALERNRRRELPSRDHTQGRRIVAHRGNQQRVPACLDDRGARTCL